MRFKRGLSVTVKSLGVRARVLCRNSSGTYDVQLGKAGRTIEDVSASDLEPH